MIEPGEITRHLAAEQTRTSPLSRQWLQVRHMLLWAGSRQPAEEWRQVRSHRGTNRECADDAATDLP
jgi:hypothetical protein